MALDPYIRQIEQALPAFLQNRRWYRAKALSISQVSLYDIVHADGFPILIANLQYEAAPNALYLIPVNSAPGEFEDAITKIQSLDGPTLTLHDAVSEPLFRSFLFRALTCGASFSGDHGTLVAQPSLTVTCADEPGIIDSVVSRAEQSNTSIIFDKSHILKLFRRIEAGINPDVEVGSFLTACGFKNSPAVVGTLEYRSKAGEVYSAGILQEFVANRGDAWKYTLDSLSDFYARARESNLDPSALTPDAPELAELIGPFAVSAMLLGTRTAQMHTALASGTTPDFWPEPFTKEDAQNLAAEIRHQAETTFSLLNSQFAKLGEAEQSLGHRVREKESQIRDRIDALPSLSTSALRIRHHGDYHLGQVLYTGTDFMIIDFEGEPARPLSERREKALVLRDVAGMLRSFQYAAYAALPEEYPDSAPWSELWTHAISNLYLGAYIQ
jgi:maltose alpha-D-glucosyltransferase/alpha-amylase